MNNHDKKSVNEDNAEAAWDCCRWAVWITDVSDHDLSELCEYEWDVKRSRTWSERKSDTYNVEQSSKKLRTDAFLNEKRAQTKCASICNQINISKHF